MNNFDSRMDPQERPTPLSKPRFAGLWHRFAANILDNCLFIPIILISHYNLFNLKWLLVELLLSGLWIVYKPYMEYRYGATLGKMVLKIKVVNTQYNAIDSDQAVRRFLVFLFGYMGVWLVNYWLFTHPEFMEVVDYESLGKLQKRLNAEFIINVANIPLFVSVIAMMFDPQKQALHDQFAGTYCIYKSSEEKDAFI
ncbi:MAG: RDD family protein [Bacteroidota bacterium]